MCGRYTLTAPPAQIETLFDLPAVPPLDPRYNIAPTQPVLTVLHLPDTPARNAEWAQWGLVPQWAKDPSIGARMINARSETAADKPAFRAAMKYRRCLVVADGFYEWKALGKAAKGKQPYYFRLPGHQPFAFAGLYEIWSGTDDSALLSCTILTTEPNPAVAAVHDRMPVILQPADHDRWIDPAQHDASRVVDLLRPYAGEMESFPVSRTVNSPANDTPPVHRAGLTCSPDWSRIRRPDTTEPPRRAGEVPCATEQRHQAERENAND